MPGLFLVEFAVLQRFHRAVGFPFLQGRSRRAGVPCTWVRFGVPADSQSTEGGSGVSLKPAEVETLLAKAHQAAPEHIVFSHRPSQSLATTLVTEFPGASFGYVAESDPALEQPVHVGSTQVVPVRSGLEQALGAPVSSNEPWQEEPDYSWVPGNEAATEMDVLPFVFTGEECTYNRSFKLNPFFAEEDLDNCVRSGGCAFCRRPPNGESRPGDAMGILQVQLRQVKATSPTFGRRQRIRLVGEIIMENIAAVAQCILQAALLPSDFLLDSRADTLLRKSSELREALRALSASGHAVHLCLIGIENFCSEELRRYNKGIDGPTNIRATREMFELERDFPEHFQFREHGGLSLITYNPWTTPQQLDLNLTVVDLLGLEEVAGKLVSGRLRLYKGLPLEARARREGLLVERYEDPLLDTARHNFYEQETPWRFREPLMEPINRILVRLRKNSVQADFDDLTRKVQQLESASLQTVSSSAAFAHHVVEAALLLGQTGTVPSPEQILDAVAERIRFHTQAPRGEEWAQVTKQAGTDQYVEQGGLPVEQALVVKPVIKKEPLRADELSVWLDNPAYPNATSRQRNWSEGHPQEVWELFFGHDKAKVLRAIELTNLLERRDIEESARSEANIEVGVLLGYPKCCATGFANEPTAIQTPYFFASVARRVETPGEVDFTMNPVSGLIEYVPCSLTCEESVRRTHFVLDSYLWENPMEKEDFVQSLKNPWFILHSLQRSFVEVLPEQEPSERCRYRAGKSTGVNHDSEAIAQGDEWVMEEETLVILRKGRPISSLSGRAYLWWNKRPFQEAFWKQVLEFRRRVKTGPTVGKSEPAAAPPAPLPQKLLILQRILTWMRDEQVDLAGFKVRSIESTGGDRLRFRLLSAHEGITLVAQEKQPGMRMLFGVGPFALSYTNDSPLTSPSQWKGARSFVAVLQKTLEGMARRQAGK